MVQDINLLPIQAKDLVYHYSFSHRNLKSKSFLSKYKNINLKNSIHFYDEFYLQGEFSLWEAGK